MPADPLGVRTACRRVVAEATDVSLGPLDRLLAAIGDLPVPAWDRHRHYDGPRLAEYVLVLSTLNFSFWGSGRGYWELAEALRDAFREGAGLADPAHLAAIEEGELRRLIGDLPLLGERAAALRELGAMVVNDFGGDLRGLVGDSALGIARLLSSRLTSYADFATYRGERVPLLKRAQIAAADLWGSGAAAYPDLPQLTCFPDYKLPQVLRHYGALTYSDALARRIDGRQELAPGEPAEVEIRAATVVAVENLREALAGRGRRLLAIEVDWILWSHSQALQPLRPYHRTRTVFY